jgi:hypothetical protein
LILDNANDNSVLDSRGVKATSAFNIARTPHMFKILSSGLYSNKIAAVLREIGCNATDAHIMNKSADLPIQVKLPSPLDRSFYIKDWGPGLDNDEVTELYTTYGWSSKQQNQEVTGAFGLGSKSPFAYTLQNKEDADGFTVEAVKEGVKRIYTCYISESGAPAISMLYEGPSEPEWTHGVKVSFPVQAPDIPEFHEQAKVVYKWFKTPPEILGLTGSLPTLDYLVKTEEFGLAPQDAKEQGPCVVMGGVAYPIVAASLRDLRTIEQVLLNTNVTLWVPMGSVMMTPSREGLEYTENTRKSIQAHLEKAALAVAKRIYDEVTQPANSAWEWYTRIQGYYTSLPPSVRICLTNFLECAGMDKAESNRILDVVTKNVALLPGWVGASGAPRGVTVRYFQKDIIDKNRVTRKEVVNGKIYGKGDNSTAVGLAYGSNVGVFYGEGKRIDARVRLAIKSGTWAAILLVTAPVTAVAKDYAEKIAKNAELDGIPFKGTDVLPLPIVSEEDKKLRRLRRLKTPRELYGNLEVTYRNLTPANGDRPRDEILELNDIPSSGRYYVQMREKFEGSQTLKLWNLGSAPMEISGYSARSTKTKLERLLLALDTPITGYVVVAVRTATGLKKLKLEELGFKPLLPSLQAAVQEPVNWSRLTKGYTPFPDLDTSSNYLMNELGPVGSLAWHIASKTAFGNAVKVRFGSHSLMADVNRLLAQPSESQKEDALLVDSLRGVAMACSGFTLPSSLATTSLLEIKESLRTKYPLTRYLDVISIRHVPSEATSEVLDMLDFVFSTSQGMAAPELLAA